MSGEPPSIQGRLAFTLIELLVTIAIIGVLTALLLSAVNRAKGAGQKTACLNNHRQLVLGWKMYADDFGDRLAPNVNWGQWLPHTNWVAGHLYNDDERANTDLLVNHERSLLAPYLPNAKIYKCPSDKSELARSVSMNNRMNPVFYGADSDRAVLGGYGTNYMIYRRLSQMRNPSKLFVTIDEPSDSINDGYFAVDLSNTGDFGGGGMPNPYWWVDSAGWYHNKGGLLSFADGHAEHKKWLESSTLARGPRHTSPNDRDLAWLQERTAELK